MPRYRKDTLRPATYSVPDKSGKKRRSIKYTDADTQHLAKRFRDMKAAGLKIPVVWEHQADGLPLTEEQLAERLADRARRFIGYADGVDLDAAAKLDLELEVPDESDARQFEKVGFVSPGIVHDYIDGSGHLWPGRSIVHLAVTPRPVQHNQNMPERLSLSLYDFECLSLDDLEDDPVDDNDADDTPVDTKPDGEGEGEGSFSVEEVMKQLEEFGIHLAPGTTEENFFQHLSVALHALQGAKDSGSELDTPDKTEEPEPVPEQSPVMMSMQRQLEGLRKTAVKGFRKDLTTRIEALKTSGRISKPVRDKLMSELKAENLSLTDDGELAQSRLLAKVEAYEDLDKGAFLSMDRGQPTPVPDPDEQAAEAEKKDNEEMANKLSRGRFLQNKAARN